MAGALSKTWREGVPFSFIWNGGISGLVSRESEDILERPSVPGEGRVRRDGVGGGGGEAVRWGKPRDLTGSL